MDDFPTHSSSLVELAAFAAPPTTTMGNAAINAIITVFHAQDGEELTILPNAVPGYQRAQGLGQTMCRVRGPICDFFYYDYMIQQMIYQWMK